MINFNILDITNYKVLSVSKKNAIKVEHLFLPAGSCKLLFTICV